MQEPENRNGAFPRLGDAQRERLRQMGCLREVKRGELLFREGDESYDFFVVETGSVAIVQWYGKGDKVVAIHGPHRFLGELNLLTGTRVYLTAIVREDGEVIQVPVAALRRLVAEDEELGNIVMNAFIARRSILIEAEAGMKVLGSRYSQDSRRLRDFLQRNRMPYRWMDLDQDEDADKLLHALGLAPTDTPVVLDGGGGVLRNPSNAQLAAALGLGASGPPPALCDLVVVGGGPAGLAAALYGASEGLETQAVDAMAFGGQAGTSSRIENYLGFPAGISGGELAARAALQARKFGARLVVPARAVGFARKDGHYSIDLDNGQTVNGRTVIVATGAQYRKLPVESLERYEGLGVYYAATQAEGRLCAGDPVVVVGGGNSAGQAAVFLSRMAESCQLLIRRPDLGGTMSRYLIDEIERRSQVHLRADCEVVELHGEPVLESVVVQDTRTGERTELPAKALFVFIGASPHTGWLGGQLACDEDGFVLCGRDLEAEFLGGMDAKRPLSLEGSLPGVFAVGDVRSGSVKRVASAVGEGSMAVRLVFERLASL